MILGFSSARIIDARRLLSKLRQSLPTVELQVMRADRIAGEEHLSFAASNALRAFRQKYKRSKSLGMEILLYASCQRQISKAIQMLGVSPQTRAIAVVGLSKSKQALARLPIIIEKMTGGKPDSKILEVGSGRKLLGLKKLHGITARELEATRVSEERDEEVVKRLVVERSALLAFEG